MSSLANSLDDFNYKLCKVNSRWYSKHYFNLTEFYLDIGKYIIFKKTYWNSRTFSEIRLVKLKNLDI